MFTTKGFTKQNEFLRDLAPLKAAQCTRRAGKSFSAGLMLFEAAYKTPGVSVLYLALTRESAKRIMVKDCLSVINREKKLSATLNLSELSFTLPNGSVVYLLGADSSADEMSKLLGQKYALVVIDEAAFWSQDLRKLVHEILKPACFDLNGQIVMISTTSDSPTGFYYDVVTGKEPGWSVHKWTTADNPFMAKQWAKELAELEATSPDILDTPAYRRMLFNEWVTDHTALVYAFRKDKHTVPNLPPSRTEPVYLAGMDLGFNDATTFVVGAMLPHDRTLYVVDSFSQSGMNIAQVADMVNNFKQRYGADLQIYVDPASKQVVEDLRQRYGLHLRPVAKTDKAMHIKLLNTDLAAGSLKVVNSSLTEPLQDQLGKLIWDPSLLSKGVYRELASCKNDLADSFYYLWRSAKAFAAQPSVQKPSEAERMILESERKYTKRGSALW